jgi:TolB protein
MGRYRIAVALGTIAALVAGTPAVAAEAALRRPDGRILTLAVTQGHGSGELRSVRPDGTGVVAYGRELPWYSSPDYAPDGAQIAYVGDFSVWLMGADGSNDRPLAGGPCGPSSPRWSPDGRWVAFESCSDIYVVSADGPAAGLRNVTANDLNDLQAAWNPRGTRIATATLPGVHVYRAGGSPAREISSLPGAFRLDWNPNGRTLAVAANEDLWLIDVRTGAEVQLTDTPDLVESDPVWSPDGRWLAFGRGPVDPDHPDEQGAARDPQVWLMTATGARAHSTGVPGIPTSWRSQP